MLKRVDENSLNEAELLISSEPIYNLRIYSLLNAYGTKYNFFNVYINNTTVLAELEGNFIIGKTYNCNNEDVESFLKFSPRVLSVVGEKESVKKIVNSENSRIYSVMVSKKTYPDNNKINLCKPSLKEVYNLLKENMCDGIEIGEFMPWYADMSHRIRHNCAEVYSLNENGQLAAVLLITAMSADYALIGGVLCDKRCRNKGYATNLLNAVGKELSDSKRTPVLECKKELEGFYEKLGYEKTGEYASIDLSFQKM